MSTSTRQDYFTDWNTTQILKKKKKGVIFNVCFVPPFKKKKIRADHLNLKKNPAKLTKGTRKMSHRIDPYESLIQRVNSRQNKETLNKKREVENRARRIEDDTRHRYNSRRQAHVHWVNNHRLITALLSTNHPQLLCSAKGGEMKDRYVLYQ